MSPQDAIGSLQGHVHLQGLQHMMQQHEHEIDEVTAASLRGIGV